MQIKWKVTNGSLLFLFALLIGSITSLPFIKDAFNVQNGGNVLSSTEQSVSQDHEEALVQQVIDGDTIKVLLANEIKTIRLIGVDSPESVHPQKPVECFGKEASSKLNEVTKGKEVHLKSDTSQGNQDKYGRLLRYVFLADNTDVNLLMIEQGYAYEYTYDEPYVYQKKYIEAQKDAEKQKKGLWADDACSKQ